MAGKKTVRQVCKCENCGNEAEMVVTCMLPEEGNGHVHEGAPAIDAAHLKQRIKGTATCTTCGNEADMWVDLD